MPKKILGFSPSYLKKEVKDAHGVAHEKKESQAHETKEHAAVQKMLRAMKKR